MNSHARHGCRYKLTWEVMKANPLLFTSSEDPFVCAWNELEKVESLFQQIQLRINENIFSEEKRRKRPSNFWQRGEKIESQKECPNVLPFVIKKETQLYKVENLSAPYYNIERTYRALWQRSPLESLKRAPGFDGVLGNQFWHYYVVCSWDEGMLARWLISDLILSFVWCAVYFTSWSIW